MGKYGVEIKWLAVTSFELRFDGTTVVTDPFITDCLGTDLDYTAVERCDIICLTHAHYDHITDIPKLMEKFDPIVLCGEMTALPLAKWLNAKASRIYPMSPNLELDFNDVKIKALFGRHRLHNLGFNDIMQSIASKVYGNDEKLAELRGVGSLEYRNFLFTTSSGVKILVWGNDTTVEQVNICKNLQPDIAILQRTNNQEQHEKLAQFIKEIGCKIFIPHHHDFKGVDSPENIQHLRDTVKRVAPSVEFVAPIHGEWLRL